MATVGWICERVMTEAQAKHDLLAGLERIGVRVDFQQVIVLLDGWLSWTRRSRLQPFVRLARTITEQRAGIQAVIEHGLSNTRIEQLNTSCD